MAACTPASLWLLTAWPGQMPDRQFTQIFCEADTVNGALRRGQGSWVVRSRIDDVHETLSGGSGIRRALRHTGAAAAVLPRCATILESLILTGGFSQVIACSS